VNNHPDRLQIGAFAELVGLSIPQLRRYDRLSLLEPAGRSSAGYRYYTSSQTGAARVIALLRSIDMPIADVRRIVSGADDTERQQIFIDHRARLEARLDEVRCLLEAVDTISKEPPMSAPTELSTWLHVMPRVPVSDVDRSISYYQEALGLDLAWRTDDGHLAAIATAGIEILLLVSWTGEEPPPPQSFYVYVEDPDALCAEFEQAGANIVDDVALRPHGMRDFAVSDPDGHRFTLGRGDEALRDAAAYYGLEPDEIAVDPTWLRRGKHD
jgi:DNA-binding transcriptional MerR regulator/catechol 2,3-dioxygenase-like lactoylglutathione lyase family enzyme